MLFNVYTAAAQGIATVCPEIDIYLRIVLQEHRTHTDTHASIGAQPFRFRGIVQGGAAALITTPQTLATPRVYHIYITTDLEILGTMQPHPPYHLLASFAFGGREVSTQVTSYTDRRHNGWARLDTHECRTPPPI